MDFTTTARVARRIKAGNTSLGTEEDVLLGQMITSTSAAAEAYLDRVALIGTQTEYHDVEPGQVVWSLRGFPCTTFTTAHHDDDQAFATEALVDSDDYYNPTYGNGMVFRMRSPLIGGDPNDREIGSLKLVYTGGMAASAATMITSYPDVAMAVEIQVAHDYLRKLDLGTIGKDVTPRASAVAGFWIDEALALLAPHRRLSAS